MSIQLPDARQLSDEALQVLRLRALRGIELGYSELELADLLGVCHETISRWWTAYLADGLPALPGGRTGRPLGSGRFLSDRQAERIKARIDLHSPEEVGIPHALWTRRAVRDLIRKELGIDLAERTVGLYLRRWGYTSKRPARHARHQDPDEVEEWLLDTYPAIESQAEREGAELLWADEVGVAADQHPGYGYARAGERDHGGAPAAPPGQPDLGRQQRGHGPVHDLPGQPQRGGVPDVFDPVDRRGAAEGAVDRGPVARAQDGGCERLGGGAAGPDRGILSACVFPGVEPGGVFEQRHEGGSQRRRV